MVIMKKILILTSGDKNKIIDFKRENIYPASFDEINFSSDEDGGLDLSGLHFMAWLIKTSFILSKSTFSIIFLKVSPDLPA